jgi:hypothetical protein
MTKNGKNLADVLENLAAALTAASESILKHPQVKLTIKGEGKQVFFEYLLFDKPPGIFSKKKDLLLVTKKKGTALVVFVNESKTLLPRIQPILRTYQKRLEKILPGEFSVAIAKGD